MNWRRISTVGSYHLALIVMSVMFSIPTIWMVTTSFKSDREILRKPPQWFPSMPYRVKESPYLQTKNNQTRWIEPGALPAGDDWEIVQLDLRTAMWRKASQLFSLGDWPLYQSRVEMALFARAGRDVEDLLWNRLAPRISDADWRSGRWEEAVREKTTMDDVVSVWNSMFKRLELGDIHIRNVSAEDIGTSSAGPNPRLPYSVFSRRRFQLTQREIELTNTSQPFEHIMVRIGGDESYHKLIVRMEWNEATYVSRQPVVLSFSGYHDVFWKFTPQQAQEIEHNTFVHVRGESSDVPANRVRLSFLLKPTPYWQVLWYRLSENYREVFRWAPFGTYTWVSLKISVMNILAQMLVCSMVGFALARIKFAGREVLFVLILSTMMLPPQVTMVPQFLLFSKLGLYNTLVPLVVFSVMGAPFLIFLMRQFCLSISSDLIEAAKIDGCSYLAIYHRIMLPLLKPALAAVAIFQFCITWNDFLTPLIYISDANKTPLAVGLFLFRQDFGGNWAELMAGATLMFLPVAILFFMAQRYFIQGITLTGLKG